MARIKSNNTSGVKVVLWGQPGTYKSTFASRFPNPLFVDPNGGPAWLGVERETVSSWKEVEALVKGIESGKEKVKTLVLDEFAELEELLIKEYCEKHGKKELGSFSHGKGFTGYRGLISEFIRDLDRIVYKGVNVVIALHSLEKLFSNPEGPDYDKYSPTLDRGAWAKLFRFADAVFFFGSKVLTKERDDGKVTARKGEMKIFCRATALFDAKNRFNMPASILNDHDATAKMFRFVDGTRLLVNGKLREVIEKNKNFKETMNDQEMVSLYNFIQENK